MIKWCDSVAQAARTLGCINGEAFSNADVSVPARVPSSGHVSPYTGRSCSTGYTPGAKDCCEAFVFVAEMVTAAVAQLLWGTLNAIVEYGYCTFVLDTLSS